MASFEKHREAAVEFHKEVAKAAQEAVKSLGNTLRETGEAISDPAHEPGSVLVDTLLGIAEASAEFRQETFDALTDALKTLRAKGGGTGSGVPEPENKAAKAKPKK